MKLIARSIGDDLCWTHPVSNKIHEDWNLMNRVLVILNKSSDVYQHSVAMKISINHSFIIDNTLNFIAIADQPTGSNIFRIDSADVNNNNKFEDRHYQSIFIDWLLDIDLTGFNPQTIESDGFITYLREGDIKNTLLPNRDGWYKAYAVYQEYKKYTQGNCGSSVIFKQDMIALGYEIKKKKLEGISSWESIYLNF